jgi:hypothetical protein
VNDMPSLPPIDPDETDFYFIVWCDKDGTNDGSENDSGRLQGATITTSAWTITPSGELNEITSNTAAVQIKGVSYPVNTVATIKVDSGVDGNDYVATNEITTTDGRTLNKSITIRARSK